MACPPQRLPKDAPNILIVLLDDGGLGVADTFSGQVHSATDEWEVYHVAKAFSQAENLAVKHLENRTVPAAFTASESLDVGADLGSTISNGYFDRRPFEFSGNIGRVKVRLK